MPALLARLRSVWRGVRRGPALRAEMEEEFRLHMEMRAADLERGGLAPAEAMRRARLEFGSTERYHDEGRRSRGLKPFDDIHISWLDFKLGARMLVKYPGLTIIGGLAMAFAIWVGAGAFELATQVVAPRVPLPGGDRIVALRNYDVAASRPDAQSLHDFAAWRAELKSVEDLGAYRALARNLIIGAGAGEPVEVAEMSAAGFRVARVPALHGRPLVEADESPAAPPVLVLGYDVWRRRFGADPRVVGRSVRLGNTVTTIVGVMPEGFAFPVAHNLWVPLRLDAGSFAPREGPGIQMFGRLAPGVTIEEARAELTVLGRRASAAMRETHEHLRPEIMPYTKSVLNLSGTWRLLVMSANLPLLLLVTLICSNVALLMFARAASREAEIVVRTALGASRSRIVTQLFAEALVLGGVAALVGLAAAGAGLRWVLGVVEAEFMDGKPLPFWFHAGLSPMTVVYAAALTLLAALIAGVLPALKVTRGLGSRLRQAAAGAGGLKFGGIWTAVIVTQVAVTVAFPVTAIITRRDAVQIEAMPVGFPAEEYLSLRLEMDREPPPGAPADTTAAAFAARFAERYGALARRLASEPGVSGVTYADRLPRMYHPHRLIQVDDGGAAPLDPRWPAYRVSSASVDPAFFDVVGVPARAGRTFHSGDLAAESRVAVVNESFVRLVLGGRNAVGRRLRYAHYEEWLDSRPLEPGPWFEIVGVVPDMGMAVADELGQEAVGDPKVAGIYHPVAAGAVYPAHLAVHVRGGDPMALAPRLRALATATDPALRLYDFAPVSELSRGELEFLAFWVRMLLLVSGIALALSLAAIYAVMSFTVARRTREIGIRVALGANPRRVVMAIFRRPLTQVGVGILAGGALVTVMAFGLTGGRPELRHIAMIVAYAAVMMLVCLLSCVVPTRRALRVEPTEALRSDG